MHTDTAEESKGAARKPDDDEVYEVGHWLLQESAHDAESGGGDERRDRQLLQQDHSHIEFARSSLGSLLQDYRAARKRSSTKRCEMLCLKLLA